MAFLLLVGSSAWADAGDVTKNADIDFSNAISEGVVTGTVNSMTIGGESYLQDGWLRLKETGNCVVTIPEAQRAGSRDVVNIQFKRGWGNKNGMGSGFSLTDADGGVICEFSYARWGSAATNTNTMNIDMTGMVGAQQGNAPIKERYTLFDIIINYATKTITSYVENVNSDGKGTPKSATFTASLTNTKPIAAFNTWGFGVGGNTDRADSFDDLIIKTTEGDYNVVSANYTVNWVCGSDIVKTETRTGDVGSAIVLLEADKVKFLSDDKTKKYQYVSDNTEGLTIADGGTTVVEIKLSEVDKYTYSVVDNWGNTIVSGEQFEDEAQMAYWSKYAKNDGKWYQASGEEFGMEMNNVDNEWTVNYSTESSISYFFEAENLNKTKDPATEASGVKYSAGKGIGHYSGSTWYSEPLTEGGVYTLAIAGYARRSGGENIGVSIRDAEGNMTETGKSFEYTNEGTEQINKEVEGIEIPAGYSIALVQPNWNSTSYIDYITLTKTADLVQTYTVTISNEIENGTVVADPTSAKAGDEVTLINTPAEGYEFVSYSVTGVHEELAVIVTDGKFTMPADDVTVSAEFQKKAAPTIYIETDLTAKFNNLATTKWTGSSGQVGWAAPKVKTNSGLEVAAWERYNESCDWTGDIMSSSVTGLVPGTYKIELYGAAAFTYGRGFGSTAFTGDFSKDKSDTYKDNESIDENTGVTLYAETAEGKVSKEIPIWYATNFNTSGIATATLENVIVGESGEIKIGLSKTSTSTNWHVVQLKGVTAQVPAADVLADAVEAAKSIAESDVPAKLYSEIQTAIETYDKEYSTADEYQTAINALNALVDKANGYVPLSAVLNEGAQYKANVPAEDPAIAAYDAAIADVKGAYDDAVVADIPAAVKVVEAALPALAKAQTAPGSDLTTLVNNTSWTCPQGNGPGKYQEIYTETYNESAYQPGKVIYQKIEGLIPGGVYEVKFLAVANTAWGKSNFGDGLAQVYANEVTSDISVIEQNNCNPTEYEQTLTAEVGDDGVFEYGMQNVAAGGNWYVVKGVSMTLKEVIISYSVDIAEGIENGTVEVSAKKAAAGEEVTITATPAEGYELASISVTGQTSNLAVEVTDGKFTMPADDVTVSATFAKVYAVTISDEIENGTVVADPTSAKAGDEVTLTNTPAEGYEFVSYSVTGKTIDEAVIVTDGKFTMPADDVTVSAEFKAVDPSGDEEVALAADMFYTWDGYGADASKIASATVDFKVGESVDQGATVVGTGSVDYLTYADMTGSTKVIFEGTNGTAIRLLMNRQESNTGPLVEKTATIAEGKAEISLTDLTYVHINAIKIPWNGSTGNIISAITFVKPNDPLAGPKEALKDAIAAAKMQNSVAKTEESFAALTKAITDGEAALADAQATVESLTTAKTDIETAVKGLTLAEGYAEVTKEMFKQYASVDEPGEGTATGGAYELFTASGLPYGDGSVSELKWADLTKYDKLIVTVAGTVAPRFCMNRLVKDGQQAATQEDSKMLDINPNNGNTWSTEKYQTASDGVYTIDLAAIVKDYTFARLHCIKAQGGGSTVVTGMYLHEAPAPVVYAVTIAEGIEGGTVAADPTSAKEGDEVTLINTPAEGYEFVSYSVTGKSTDVAVIVTDGKFTMPADDVTVNATFQKKSVIYIETDLTAKFNSLATTKWTGSSGQVGWAAPKVKTNSGLEVAAWERYNESCDWTGDIMSSSVTGLVPGTYKIELYGAAAFTYGRGFGSTAFTGDFSKDKSDTYKDNESIDENTGVTLYAETAEGKVSKEIPIWYATNFNTSGIATATLENVIVGESGEIKIGLSKTSTSTNWHVVQLKGVTAQVPAADVLADAVEAAKSIAESDVPAALYSEIQEAITTYDKEYSTADEYLIAINALNALVDKANGYAPLSAVLNEGAQYKANVPAESPAIAAYDAAIADVKSAYDAAVVADIPAAVKVVEAALPAIAKAQTAPNSDMTRVIVNPTIDGATGWTCEKPKGGNGPLLNGTAFEYWAGNASPRSEGSFDYYQVIEGLPSGKYIISAEMYNSLNGEEGAVFAPTSGVYASSGNDETATLVDVDGTEYIRYATEPVFVKDGTLRLGVKNTEIPMAARWFSADNFTLTLVETIPTYEVDLAEPQNGAIEVSAAVAAEGDKVVITATPNEGYELESVSVKGVTSDIAVQVVTDEVTGEMSFTMPKDAVEVSATFKQIAYPITYAIGMQNGTVEGPVESVAGEKVTLTVTPAEGYELENLTITCAESQNEINYDVVDYSFTMPKEGVYIIATFVQTTGIDAASAAKGKKIGVKKYFKNGELIIIGKDGKEFRANGAAK